MYERFNEESRRVLQAACQEARRWQHAYIGTEHLLLAMLPKTSGFWPRFLRRFQVTNGASPGVDKLLRSLAVDPLEVRTRLERGLRAGPYPVDEGRLPQTPPVKRVIDRAMCEARRMEQREVQPVHLLLGILWEEQEPAAQVLRESSIQPGTLRQALQSDGSPAQAASSAEGRE
jgi:ATP-dependent Clp protease ATP-binding subunit ClpC